MPHLNQILNKLPPWLVYLLGIIPAIWWFWQGLSGALGPEPVKTLEHLYGETALQLLLVTLAITPLQKLAGLRLIKFRRALGLMAFFYVVAHLSVYLFLDQQLNWAEIWKDIVKRPYITFGMIAFILMIPLAVTSNNLSLRKLGPLRWRKLHKAVYVIALLGAAHFVLLKKTWEAEPLIYLAAFILLLGWRAFQKGRSA